MRLIRQYRTDSPQVVLKFALAGAILSCIYGLFVTTANVLAVGYLGSENKDHDAQLLRQPYNIDPSLSFEDQISRRNDLLKVLHDPATIKNVKHQLAALYCREGNLYLRQGQGTVAEHSFQLAIENDPNNPVYPRLVAQLYADAAVKQAETDNKLNLLRSSSAYFQEALQHESDDTHRRYLAEREANENYTLAKAEFYTPNGRSAAKFDLERAKEIVPAGTPVARDIDQLLLLASN
jgi:tetratricopeptide (TPR) repeat protein